MRNLKRALSLALASIMLLGMMVTGVGAASNSFTDFDQIVNQEAAEVTSGLGIFDGYTDGSFGPEKVVTRAEMAVIICKLLNGSDVDPGNFIGISKFNDVPAWAEGYVNYCAASGIVVGVGEGKFNPSATVTTVEAATMLLKALGYFTEEDQLKEDWKTVVTGRATSLGLYGDLTLTVDDGLTRDNVAELVFNTLFAQRVAYDDNRQLYVKNTNRDVVVTNGTQDYLNTFAENTFHMWVVDGLVTANSYSDDTLSQTVNNLNRTNVQFKDGSAQEYPANSFRGTATTGSNYPFEYTTGLDMIGRAVRVYYRWQSGAPTVYAIADRSFKYDYVTYDSNNANLSDAANALGFRKNTIAQISPDNYKVNYSWNDTVGTLKADNIATNDVDLTPANQPAKTLVVISNSSDFKVDTVIVLDQYLDRVDRIVSKDDENAYTLLTRNGSEQNIALEDVAEGDYVVVTDIGKQGETFDFYKPEIVTANITKISNQTNSLATVKSIVADGTEYKGSPVDYRYNQVRSLKDTKDFEAIETNDIGEAGLILDFQGKCIGLTKPEGNTLYAYVAQYREVHVTDFGTDYKLMAKLYFSDGTEGNHVINTTDMSADNMFYGFNADGDDIRNEVKALNGDTGSGSAYSDTYYDPATFKPVDKTVGGKTFKGMSLTSGTTGFGVFKVSIRSDDSVVLSLPGTADQAARAQSAVARLIADHSTLVATQAVTDRHTNGNMSVGGNVTTKLDANNNSYPIYQNDKTVYFYVDGQYGSSTDPLSVGVVTGVENATGVTQNSKQDDNRAGYTVNFAQLFERNESNVSSQVWRYAKAMLITNWDLGTGSDLYFFKQGMAHREPLASSRASGDRYQVTYDMYDVATGEPKAVVYNNNGAGYDANKANEMVNGKATGFYTIGGGDIQAKFVNNDPTVSDWNTYGKYTFVLNAKVDHVDHDNNLYTDNENVGGITRNATVIDTTGNNINSIRDIADKCANNHTVTICYVYTTSGSNQYKVDTVFVSGYSQKPLTPGTPGGSTNRPSAEYTEIASGGAAATGTNGVNEKLNKGNTVVTSDWAPSDKVSVPADRVLNVQGDFTPTNTVDNSGTIIVDDKYVVDNNQAVYGTVYTSDMELGSGSTTAKGSNVYVENTVTVPAGESTTIKGNMVVDGKIEGGTNSTLIVEGTLTVRGKTISTGTNTIDGLIIIVKSDDSLYVTGDLSATSLTVGGTTASERGKVEVSGNLTLTGELAMKDGTLTVGGKLTAGTLTGTGDSEKSITFGTNGSVDSKIASMFVNGEGLVVNNVAGLTFTYDETVSKFVNKGVDVPDAVVDVFFVYDRASYVAASDAGMPEKFDGGTRDDAWWASLNKAPWIVTRVTRADGTATDKTFTLEGVTLNGRAVEFNNPAVNGANDNTGLKFDGTGGGAHTDEGTNSTTVRWFGMELLTPSADRIDGKDYLKQDTAANGDYVVTISYDGKTYSSEPANYGGQTAEKTLTTIETYITNSEKGFTAFNPSNYQTFLKPDGAEGDVVLGDDSKSPAGSWNNYWNNWRLYNPGMAFRITRGDDVKAGDQLTISSLKVNGKEVAVGGGLSSFHPTVSEFEVDIIPNRHDKSDNACIVGSGELANGARIQVKVTIGEKKFWTDEIVYNGVNLDVDTMYFPVNIGNTEMLPIGTQGHKWGEQATVWWNGTEWSTTNPNPTPAPGGNGGSDNQPTTPPSGSGNETENGGQGTNPPTTDNSQTTPNA